MTNTKIPTNEIKTKYAALNQARKNVESTKATLIAARGAQDSEAQELGNLQANADLFDEKAVARIGVLIARAPLHAKPIAAAEKNVTEAEEAKEASWRVVKNHVDDVWTAEYERRKVEATAMLDNLFGFADLSKPETEQMKRSLLPRVTVLKSFWPLIEGLRSAKSETDSQVSDGQKLDEYVALLLDGKFPA